MLWQAETGLTSGANPEPPEQAPVQLPRWSQLAVQLIWQRLLLTQGVDSLVVLLAVPQASPPAPHDVRSGSFVKCEVCAALQQLPLKVVKATGLVKWGAHWAWQAVSAPGCPYNLGTAQMLHVL